MAAKFVCLTTRTACAASLERLGLGWVVSGGDRQDATAAGLKAAFQAIRGSSEAPFSATELTKSATKAVKSVAQLTNSVMESVKSVTESVKSVAQLTKSVTESVKSVAQLTKCVMESVKSVAQLSKSVMKSVNSVTDLISWFTDLINSVTQSTSFDKDGYAFAPPMTLSAPDQNTSGTDQPRYRERGFRPLAPGSVWATCRHARVGLASLLRI